MKNFDIYGGEHKNNLIKLKYSTIRVIYILAFLVLFSSKISSFLKIPEESVISKTTFYLSIVFGIFYLILDRRLKKVEIKLLEFKSEIEFKESFFKILMQVLTVESSYRFETRDIGNLHDKLHFPFTISDLESYIIKWKKIGSIFSYKISDETPESTTSLLLLPIRSLQDVARFLGTREFSRQIIINGLKHNIIVIKSEIHSGDDLTISYDINLKYT